MTTPRPDEPSRAPAPAGPTSSGAPAVERREDCPVCGWRELRPREAPRSWVGEREFGPLRGSLGVSACTACGFLFVNPRPVARLLEAFYGGPDYAFHDPGASASGEPRALELLELLGGRLAGRRLLDFGCGAGTLLRCAARVGWVATGFDVAAPAVGACRLQGLDATDDLGSLQPGGFDAVVLHHVLEHLPEPRRALGAVRALLSKGGRLLVEVPNVRSLRARLSHPRLVEHARFDERYRAFPIHLSYFDPRTLARLLVAEGFEVETSTTRGMGLDVLLREPEPGPATVTTTVPAAVGEAPAVARATRPGLLRRLLRAAGPVGRPLVRRFLLERGLGENVLVLARAAGRASGG